MAAITKEELTLDNYAQLNKSGNILSFHISTNTSTVSQLGADLESALALWGLDNWRPREASSTSLLSSPLSLCHPFCREVEKKKAQEFFHCGWPVARQLGQQEKQRWLRLKSLWGDICTVPIIGLHRAGLQVVAATADLRLKQNMAENKTSFPRPVFSPQTRWGLLFPTWTNHLQTQNLSTCWVLSVRRKQHIPENLCGGTEKLPFNPFRHQNAT